MCKEIGAETLIVFPLDHLYHFSDVGVTLNGVFKIEIHGITIIFWYKADSKKVQ